MKHLHLDGMSEEMKDAFRDRMSLECGVVPDPEQDRKEELADIKAVWAEMMGRWEGGQS